MRRTRTDRPEVVTRTQRWNWSEGAGQVKFGAHLRNRQADCIDELQPPCPTPPDCQLIECKVRGRQARPRAMWQGRSLRPTSAPGDRRAAPQDKHR